MAENPSKNEPTKPVEDKEPLVAFCGSKGAYPDMACRTIFPDLKALPCETFQDVAEAIHNDIAVLAVVPIEHSVVGRHLDIHNFLPDSGLHIVGEHFQPVGHCLMAPHGASVENLEAVYSHERCLAYCQDFLSSLKVKRIPVVNTAEAAKEIAQRGNNKEAAIASSLAAHLYDLNILRYEIHDSGHPSTRYLILAKEPVTPPEDSTWIITSFIFRIQNEPATLYKAIAGFATAGINLTKLDGCLLDDQFVNIQFYCDAEAALQEPEMERAMEELKYFAEHVQVLGTYAGHPHRHAGEEEEGETQSPVNLGVRRFFPPADRLYPNAPMKARDAGRPAGAPQLPNYPQPKRG